MYWDVNASPIICENMIESPPSQYTCRRGYYPDDKNKPNQDAWSIYTQWGGLDQDAFFGVFDGHGPYGHDCANFAKKNLPNVVCKYVRSSRLRLHTSTPPPCTSPASRQSSISSRRSWRSSIADEEEKLPESLDDDLVIMPVSKTLASNVPKKTWDPKSWPMLSQVMLEECLRLGHIECNQSMHVAESVKDRVSGTTAISAVFHNNLMTISNVGDSRAILGRRVAQTVDQDRLPQVLEHLVPQVPEQERAPVTAKLFSRDASKLTDSLDLQVTTLQAVGLSVDQTPYRKDELERVKAAGARVLSLDQLEGVEPHHENWPFLEAGVDIDVEGDPPRVWVPNGDYPGTAFTRSLGDSEADAIGVIAEPEINTLSLTPDDKILILASDGVFEFLPNQDVIDICSQYTDPLDAAEAVVRAAYDLWFSYELRTDDITIIVVFLDWHNDKDVAPRVPRPLLMESKKGDVSSLKTMENNESHKAVELCAASPGYFKSNVEKSMLQVEFLLHILDVTPSFQNMTEIQRELIIHAMEPLNVSAGHILLQQGEVGDHFYVLEEGQVSVRVSKLDVVGDVVVHTLSGSAQTFGEVALIQSIPSSHSLVAETDSRLWKLTRSAFQTVRSEISSNHKRVLFYMLLQLPQLHLLNPVHLWKLVKHMDSVTVSKLMANGRFILHLSHALLLLYSLMMAKSFSTRMLLQIISIP